MSASKWHATIPLAFASICLASTLFADSVDPVVGSGALQPDSKPLKSVLVNRLQLTRSAPMIRPNSGRQITHLRQHAPATSKQARKLSTAKPIATHAPRTTLRTQQADQAQRSHQQHASAQSGRPVQQVGHHRELIPTQQELGQLHAADPIPIADPSHAVAPVNYTQHVHSVNAGPLVHSCCPGGYSNQARPLGSSMDAHFDAQIHNGYRARQVLYHYDFQNGPDEDRSQLNLAGRRKLARLMPIVEATGQPLLIQSIPGQPQLSAARRSQVLSFAQTSLGFPISDSQVIVGEPHSQGLRAAEAITMDANLLQNTRSFGSTAAGSQQGGFSGGSGTQGSR